MLPTVRRRGYAPLYMSDFFQNDFDSLFGNTRRFIPAVNIREDDKAYMIELAAPGMNKSDFKIEIEKDLLMISYETKEEKSEEKNGYSRREFAAQSFCRNFTLPENANRDKISAAYKDGILKLEILKSEEEPKLSKVIKIS